MTTPTDPPQPLATRIMTCCVSLAIGIVALAAAGRAALWILDPYL